MKIVLIQYDDHKIFVCTTHFESEFNKSVCNKLYQYNRCADILYQIYCKTKIPIFFCADTNVCNASKINSIRHLLINMDGKTHG